MKGPVTLGVLLLSVCFVSSCIKEHPNLTVGLVLNEYTTMFDSSQVYHHFYQRDSTGKVIAERDSTKNTVLYMDVVYNNSGKATKASFRQDAGPVTFTYEFEYNAAGKISKRQRRSGSLQVDEDYNIYSYDANGRLVADSQYSIAHSSSYQLAWVSKFSYVGNNVTSGENYQMVNGALVLYARVKNEYDNKMNPFWSLENEYFYNEAGSAIYTITVKCLNNVVNQYAAKGTGDYQLQQTSTYQYNSNGYVSKGRSVNVTQAHQNADMEYFYGF